MANGVRIACRLQGDATAPAMVLLHATGETSASWAAVARSFSGAFHVVSLDLRGHGASEWPGVYSLELMRDDVLGVLDELALTDATLVGHSLGGAVAYLVASAPVVPGQPDRVRRLVVEDACPPYPRDAAVPDRPPGELAFDWDLVAPLRAQLNDPTRRLWPGLTDIRDPTLVVGGGPTSPIPQDLLAEVVAAVPDSELVTIGVGHMIHDDAPERFLAALHDWLARHP